MSNDRAKPFWPPPPPAPPELPPVKWNEEKLRALLARCTPEEINRGWNAGLALACVSLAMQDRLIDPPEPPRRTPAKK